MFGKRKKKKGGDGSEETVESLKQQLAEKEKENKSLRQQLAQRPSGGGSGSGSRLSAEQPAAE